ncbi:ImmA/IrrE family metallo-endopeptidase [Lactococcus garvieae]
MTSLTTSDFVPHFDLAQNSAYNVLASSQLHELPINLKKLIRSYHIQLQSYTQFSKDLNISIEMVVKLCASDDGCIMKRSDGTYLLLYNDLVNHIGRIRFTLAHEFGHFILKHHNETKDTIISRGNPFSRLKDQRYDRFEQEANYFAKRLLAPIPLVDEYTSNFNTSFLTPKIISEIFGTSKELAGYIVQELNRRSKKTNIIRETHSLLNNFKEFVNNELHTKYCTSCRSISPIPYQYCCICGNNYFIQPTINNFTQLHYLRKNHSMIYSKLKLDKEGRLSEKCPICENENLHDSYCQICGKNIINRCTGIKESTGGFLTTDTPCDKPLEGDSRYCYICGARSTFLENEILTPWSVNSKNYTEENK